LPGAFGASAISGQAIGLMFAIIGSQPPAR